MSHPRWFSGSGLNDWENAEAGREMGKSVEDANLGGKAGIVCWVGVHTGDPRSYPQLEERWEWWYELEKDSYSRTAWIIGVVERNFRKKRRLVAESPKKGAGSRCEASEVRQTWGDKAVGGEPKEYDVLQTLGKFHGRENTPEWSSC